MKISLFTIPFLLQIDTAIRSSTTYLRGKFDLLTQPYDIAIVAYALALNKNDDSASIMDRLDAAASVSGRYLIQGYNIIDRLVQLPLSLVSISFRAVILWTG